MADAAHGVGSKVTPVAEVENWRARVRNELTSSAAWQHNWGFLKSLGKGGGPYDAGEDSLDAFRRNAAAAAGPVHSSLISLCQKDTYRRERLRTGGDSLDAFVHTYLSKAGLRPYPQQEYSHPLTSNQHYGWGKSLERFGPMKVMLR